MECNECGYETTPVLNTFLFQLEDIEETLAERLAGLTEMVPDRVWAVAGRTFNFSYWLLRRSMWVLGTSLALLFLPPFIEQQRLEFEEMQNMQKKQVISLCLDEYKL